jgi:hypothetical protein
MKCTPLDPDYLIAMRDGFSCTYCSLHKIPDGGSVADSLDQLVIVQIVPKSKGGTSFDENRTTACIECARIKGDRIAFPGLDYSKKDSDGFYPWKKHGKWSILVVGEVCAIEHETGYWFGSEKIHDEGCDPQSPYMIEDHIVRKNCWCLRYRGKDHKECPGRLDRDGWLCESIDMAGLFGCLRELRSIYAKPVRARK